MKIVLPGSRTNAYTPLMIEQRFCAYHSLLNIYLSNGNKKSLVTELSQRCILRENTYTLKFY